VTDPQQGSYDAVLIVSFGGPEGPDEVGPFLDRVTRGRGVPPDRLQAVAARYHARGGVSPLNAANRDLRDALQARLDIPVYWGNRNWHPFLADTVATMRDDGVRSALAFVTSVFASYSSCRQYLDDLAAARDSVGAGAPRIDRLRHAFDHPGFVEAFVDGTVGALDALPPDRRDGAHLVFSAHSIPVSMAANSGPDGGLYAAQLGAASSLVAADVARVTGVQRTVTLAYQSRSGPPSTPWLQPDLLTHIDVVDAPAVVVVPIGFTAEHMEVVHDIDVDAAGRAAARGLPFARAATPGTHPAYLEMIVELIRERRDPATPRRARSSLGPSYDECPRRCCLGPG
jgi:ferrochelatase